MSAPVDVLAVMARAHTGEMTAENAELWEARAAVAELIEAANRVWKKGGEVTGGEWDDLGNALARAGGAA